MLHGVVSECVLRCVAVQIAEQVLQCVAMCVDLLQFDAVCCNAHRELGF